MARDFQDVWDKCLVIIKDNVPPVSFKTWFEPIVPIKVADNILTIQVPSQFFYEYLEEQYIDILRKTLRKELGPGAKLEYNVVMESNGLPTTKPITVSMPTKNKTDLKNRPVSMTAPYAEQKIKNPFVIPGIKKLHVDPQLNPENTFASFVEGECNRLARAAGAAVANAPGKTSFNPLFIYGNSGLGKTHLAQAIGIETKQKHPDRVILYVSAARFQTQFVESVRTNNTNDFLHFYQMIDLLIVDDIHELAGKEKTQDTFFHIFNHLHQAGKQLIITSDKPPVELNGLEQRLLSRFKWGLSADLQPPDFETRVAILKQRMYTDGISQVPEEVVEYLASCITNNIRELEGALVSVLAQSTLNRKQITVELAADVIETLVKNVKKEISIDFIQKTVCEYFGLPNEMLHTKTRKREIVQARQIAMFFSKNLTKSSLSTIGSLIGGKDHATVLHACKTINNLIETDKRFKSQVDSIERKLKM